MTAMQKMTEIEMADESLSSGPETAVVSSLKITALYVNWEQKKKKQHRKPLAVFQNFLRT